MPIRMNSIFSVLSCSVLFLSSLHAVAADFTVNIAHVAAKDSPIGRSVVRVAKELTKKGFKTQEHHALGAWKDLKVKGELAGIQALAKDELQLLFLTDGPCGNIAPSCTLFSMPYLFEGADHAFRVADHETVRKHIGDDFSKEGMRLIAMYENGWRHTFSPIESIKSPEQLKEKKIRTMQSPVYLSYVAALGAKPNPTAWNDVYALTKQKLVHAIEAPLTGFYASKLYETNKYVTLTGHIYSVFYALVSQKAWDKMNEEQRKAITSVVWEERTNQRKDNQAEDLKVLDFLKKQPQLNVYTPSKEEMQKFVAAGKQVYNEMKDKYPAEVLKVVEDQRVK